jgi:hypothetical protein
MWAGSFSHTNKIFLKSNVDRLVRVFALQLVVEPGQRLDEDVDALVAELVPSGREKV